VIRGPAWEAALAAFLEEHRTATFAWGECDCVLFAAGAVAAMTGTDPAAAARGHYRTQLGSRRMLTRMGWSSLEGMMDAHLERVAPAFAQRGDVVMSEGSLGICAGRFAWFVTAEGLAPRALSAWTEAWRVPHG
jgi:hypothetical protein